MSQCNASTFDSTDDEIETLYNQLEEAMKQCRSQDTRTGG